MKTRSILAGILAAAAPIAAYHGVLGRHFVNWDDDLILIHNPHILSLGWENLKWMFSSFYMTTYQPLGWLAYALIYRCRGLDAFAFHAATLLLHAANTAALTWLVLSLLRERKGAITCAALAVLAWSLHPIQVESVAWATELPDLLAAFFFLLSILAYLRSERSRPWLWASYACFLASGLARWKGASLPLVLVMIDYYPLGKIRWRNKIPFLALGAGLVAANALAKSQIQGIHLTGALSHPVSAAYACYFYIEKTLAPVDLMPLYRLKGPMLPGACGAAAATLALFALRRVWPAGLWSWVWYIAAIFPTMATSKDGLMFGQDHYAYLALAGFAFPAALALLTLRPAFRWSIALLLLPLLGFKSRKQAAIWRDSVRLWTQAVSIDPGSCVALGNLRSALVQEKRYDEAALTQREESFNCPDSAGKGPVLPVPSSKTALAKAYSNLGVDRFEIGRDQAAVDYFTRALQLGPDIPEIQRNMAIALRRLGR